MSLTKKMSLELYGRIKVDIAECRGLLPPKLLKAENQAVLNKRRMKYPFYFRPASCLPS